MSPKPDGYRFPAEWEPHKATWLAWPHEDTFGEKYRDSVEDIWIRFVEILQKDEEVHILVQDQKREDRIRNLLEDNGVGTGNLFFHQIVTDDFWIRDNGPFFINKQNGIQAIVDWKFNAWGEKYENWKNDDAVPFQIAALLGQDVYRPDMVLEGGAVDFNGLGTCMTTESVLLNPNRNPDLAREEIEQYLKDYLGVTHFIWLPGGRLSFDKDTDGHIDLIARFVNGNTVVCALEEESADKDCAVLMANYKRLREATDQNGDPIKVITLPRGPYLNFYVANGSVLIPTVHGSDPKDAIALGIFKELFPGREVIGIDCSNLLPFGGAIHCVTQQQPAADNLRSRDRITDLST